MPTDGPSQILLPLSPAEASAVSVALMGLVHSPDPGDDHWRFAASDVFARLEVLRDGDWS